MFFHSGYGRRNSIQSVREQKQDWEPQKYVDTFWSMQECSSRAEKIKLNETLGYLRFQQTIKKHAREYLPHPRRGAAHQYAHVCNPVARLPHGKLKGFLR
jgi:hypothetical protein